MRILRRQIMLKNKVLILLCIFSGLLFVFACYKVTDVLTTTSKEKHAFDELAEIVEQAENNTETTKEPSFTENIESEAEQPVRTILPAYTALYEQNSDLFGWLTIDGTNINYPVMHTPDEPQYYLQRAFDKSNATGGTPFLDGKCTEDGGIYIIYGHHMSNGTMFASLSDYESMEYWQEHKTIRFDTLYEHGEYEVVAAFLSRIYAPESKGFRYYEYTDLKSEVQFCSFIEQVKDNELYDTGVTAEYGDTLLVLSTCNYHTNDGRFVVVARKK